MLMDEHRSTKWLMMMGVHPKKSILISWMTIYETNDWSWWMYFQRTKWLILSLNIFDEKSTDHFGSICVKSVDIYGQGWQSMKQTTLQDGFMSIKPKEWFDHGWVSMKQTTYDCWKSIKPNDWDSHGWLLMKHKTDIIGYLCIKRKEQFDNGWTLIRQTTDLNGTFL